MIIQLKLKPASNSEIILFGRWVQNNNLAFNIIRRLTNQSLKDYSSRVNARSTSNEALDGMSERQQTILNATLELVAEQGLLGTSISHIAKRAKASPGIIYHYFESKDEIMDTLFLKIFKELMESLLDDVLLKRPCFERLKEVWLRRFRYHINHPMETKFLEEYKNSAYYTKEQQEAANLLMTDLILMIQKDMQEGNIKNLPPQVIFAMTMGVAISLAKSQLAGAVILEGEELDKVADVVCHSILN